MKWFDDLRHDLRLAARSLWRDVWFSAAAIAVLAVGIGLAVAMFTIASTVLRRPLPIHDQGRVVVLWGTADRSVRYWPLTPQHFERFRRNAQTLQSVAGTISIDAWPQAVREGERALLLNVGAVTGNFFGVLGSPAILGRTLRGDDDVVGAAPVAVISHATWRRLFAAEATVLGRRLTLHQHDTTYTVVGVAPPGLEFPTGTDVWVPLAVFGAPEVVPIGRLAAGATLAQAAAELRASFAREPSSEWRGLSAVATPVRILVVGDARPVLLLLSAAAALLWLIACVNVSNLLLVRSAGRTQEIAVRRALGAGRGRIARQLFTESSLLALGGGVLGTAVAVALTRALVALAPPELPRLEEIALDGLSLGIAAGVGAAAVLLCGLLPALWTSGQVAAPMQAGDRTRTDAKATRRAYHALVVFQIGLALVVLTAAGLLARSVRALERLTMGFTAEHVAVLQLAWPAEKFGTAEQVGALYDRLVSRLDALPDVIAAAPVNVAPFTGATAGWDGNFVAEGRTRTDQGAALNLAVVGSEYFRSLGVPVLLGRGFTEADRERSVRVAIVSEGVARRLWPGQNALGKRIGFEPGADPADWWTVVGLVPETRYRVVREPAPTVYLPLRQFGPAIVMVNTILVRTAGEPSAAMRSVRQAIGEIDQDVIVTRAEPMEQLVAGQFAQARLSALLIGVFGAGALLLASVGLYAVLAYVVRRRRRELAIRHALGATPSRLRLGVLAEAAVLAGTGAVWGLLAALAGGRLLRSLLFGVEPADPLTLTSATVALTAVMLVASYLPAQRATRADPAATLREN